MRRFARDCAGSVQIEYVMIAALVALVLVSGLTTIGNHLRSIVSTASSALAN